MHTQHLELTPYPESHGRWGVVRGFVSPIVWRVNILVLSHDERWYVQKPALSEPAMDPDTGAFHTDVAFGLNDLSPLGREYVVVACVGPDLPTGGVYESLNDLPLGCTLSAPISVLRSDQSPEPVP